MGVLERQQVADGQWRQQVDERLEEHDGVLAQHSQQLAQGRDRMARIESAIQANTAMTGRIESNVKDIRDILEIFNALRGFVKVGGWLGTLAKWTAGIIVVCGLLYWWWKTGEPPKGH